MGRALRRLTVQQWHHAVDAISHAKADCECWEADGDPAAKDLRKGIRVLQMLVDEFRPAGDWQTVSETSTKKGR